MRHRVLCGACTEAEETVALETTNETDRVLCETCTEVEETVALETTNETGRVLCEACAEVEERFDDLNTMKAMLPRSRLRDGITTDGTRRQSFVLPICFDFS